MFVMNNNVKDNRVFSFLLPNPQQANYYGSLLQSSTVCLGSGLEGEVNVPFRDLLPMVHPNDIVFDGTKSSRHSPQELRERNLCVLELILSQGRF